MTFAFLAGIILGFIGSVPIAGPISALVLERTLVGQPRRARGIGVGAAFAEAAYATLAFVGMGEILTRFPNVVAAAKVSGVVVLIVVAALLLRQRDAELSADAGGARATEANRALSQGIAAGFTISILNPTLIATWSTTTATLFASGFVELDVLSTIAFALGTTIGIASWLSALVWLVQHRASRLGANGQKVARRLGALLALGVAVALSIQAAHVVTIDR